MILKALKFAFLYLYEPYSLENDFLATLSRCNLILSQKLYDASCIIFTIYDYLFVWVCLFIVNIYIYIWFRLLVVHGIILQYLIYHFSLKLLIKFFHCFVDKTYRFLWRIDLCCPTLWHKEASRESDVSPKLAKCIHYLYWHQYNIMISGLWYLSAGWVFVLETWPGSETCQVQCKTINVSDLGDLSLVSIC